MQRHPSLSRPSIVNEPIVMFVVWTGLKEKGGVPPSRVYYSSTTAGASGNCRGAEGVASTQHPGMNGWVQFELV